jgi:16S rRNA (cytosine967-C5)-methyltransferase
MQLAAAGHDVLAVDASESRLKRLRANLDRTQLEAELITADALKWTPSRQFDAILLDAPCSATGTFRRHPEVLYRARPRIIASAAELQSKLLELALHWLKPSGALVYSVCSLEPEEGEQIISAVVASHSEVAIDRPNPDELPNFAAPSDEGWIRILPGLLEDHGGLDGFFMARLVRRAG